MKTVRTYAGVVLILIWGLAPFYWMLITALRNKQFTFDTTPWPTHVTLENFQDALAFVVSPPLPCGQNDRTSDSDPQNRLNYKTILLYHSLGFPTWRRERIP